MIFSSSCLIGSPPAFSVSADILSISQALLFLGTGLPFPPQLLRKVHSLPLQGEDLGLTVVHCCPLGIVYLDGLQNVLPNIS